MKMWDIHTMEDHSAAKKNKIRQIELENILSEVVQIQKD